MKKKEFFAKQKLPETKASDQTITSNTNFDGLSLEVLKLILDQLDLLSIFRLKRVKKQLLKNIEGIPIGQISQFSAEKHQTNTYLMLRQHPELRPDIYFGELYNKDQEFKDLKSSIMKVLSPINNTQPQFSQSLSAADLALILFNMQLYFENTAITHVQWLIFKDELPNLIVEVFYPLQEKLNDKRLFLFIMRVIHEEIYLVTTRGGPATKFLSSLQAFLKIFKVHSFAIDKIGPKQFHNFIAKNTITNNIYEELCSILSGINNFLSLDLFNYFVSFLTKNKKLTNVLFQKYEDGYQVYQYLLPIFLRYYNPEKEITAMNEVEKLCNELTNQKNISNTVILSNSLAIITAESFAGNLRLQNHNLLQLLRELLSKSEEKDHQKRKKWFAEATRGLTLFISKKVVIKSEHVRFLFATAKIHTGILKIAEAMKLALDNEEKFVTLQDIQSWIKILPAKLPNNYIKFYRLGDLIYLLTKAMHALGLVKALNNRDKVLDKLLKCVIKRAHDFVEIQHTYVVNFLACLGEFYNEQITTEKIGVYLLYIIENNIFHNIETLTPKIISITCQFIKENLISTANLYLQFIDLLTCINKDVSSECLIIMLDHRTIITENVLSELQMIFQSYRDKAPLVLTVLNDYQFFKPEDHFEKISQLVDSTIKQENFALVPILQLLRKFCEANQGILDKENKDALFISLIEKIKKDKHFSGAAEFKNFLESLKSFEGNTNVFNLLVAIFAKFNLLVKETSAIQLFQFYSCCLTLYAEKIITPKQLCQIMSIAVENFNTANTFSLSLVDKKDVRREIYEQLANKSDELGFKDIPAAILEGFKKLEQMEKLASLENISNDEEKVDQQVTFLAN